MNNICVFLQLMNQHREILKKHSLKFTENRSLILKQFLVNNYALSYKDIDAMIGKKLDKVTIYRTLKSFEENGIIHEVVDGGSQVMYALCSSGSCTSNHHHDTHIHFKCNDCDKTYCLEDITPPELKLPEGYSMAQQTVFIKGSCNICK
jgi:Fur family ferric uptake transcriptional regulator